MAKSKVYKPIEEQAKTVQEPVMAIARSTRSSAFMGAIEKPAYQLTPLEKLDKLRLGLDKHDLEKLKSRTELDYDKLSKALSVTRATLINKKGSEKFSPSLTERMLSLADIYSYGYDVFEDEARFNQWMFKPNRALGGITPYDVIDNQFGREEVKNIIGRIDHGVYS